MSYIKYEKTRQIVKSVELVGILGLENMTMQGCAGIIEKDRIKKTMRHLGLKADVCNRHSSFGCKRNLLWISLPRKFLAGIFLCSRRRALKGAILNLLDIKPLDDLMSFIFDGFEAGARMDRANPYSSNYCGNIYCDSNQK